MASEAGLSVVGSVGILEELFRRGEIKDLRLTYGELLRQGFVSTFRRCNRACNTSGYPLYDRFAW